jgi:AraC family transcriptional regulator
MSSAIKIDLVQLEEPVHRPAFTIAGVRATFDQSNMSGIPALWPRLIQCLPLAGQVDQRAYGAMWRAGPQQSGTNYMAGVEVSGDAALPTGLERLEIAPQDYIVFRQTLDGSALNPQMQAAAREIWGVRLPKLGAKLAHAPDFELYPADFSPTKKGAFVDIYVAVIR